MIRERGIVLVVDDDPVSVRLFAAMLTSAGHDVREAAGGAEGLAKARQILPDLVLLDVRMPDLDGYTVTAKLKEDAATHDIPVVLITGFADQESRLRGLEAGADEFLLKPIDRSELLLRIRSMLQLKKLREQLKKLREQLHARSQVDTLGRTVAEGKTGPARILFLLNEEEARGAIASTLADGGYEIAHTGDGKFGAPTPPAGIEAAVVGPSLSDEALQEVIAAAGRVPVLAIVPPGDPGSRVRLLESGADQILVRPFEPHELLLLLGRLLERAREARSLEARFKSAEREATHDSMTGLSNHGYFRRFLDLELKRSRRHGHRTALLILDIDDFKS